MRLSEGHDIKSERESTTPSEGAETTTTAAKLRKEVDYDTQDLSVTEAKMKAVNMQKSGPMFPALVQSNGELRLRHQQEPHKHNAAKALTLDGL